MACPFGCAQAGQCLRSYPDCVQAFGTNPSDPLVCVHGVGDCQLHWTCCGRVEAPPGPRDPDVLAIVSACPHGCGAGGRCLRSYPDCVREFGANPSDPLVCVHGVGDCRLHWTCCGRVQGDLAAVLPPALRPLFTSHALFHTPHGTPAGNGMRFGRGGRMAAARQDAFWLLKWRVVRGLMPELTRVLARATAQGVDYFVTGSGPLNHHLQRRGAAPIPTDDLDIKFAPVPALTSVLEAITGEWLPLVRAELAAAGPELAALNLAVASVSNMRKGVHCLRVGLRDTAGEEEGEIEWFLAEVGPWDWDHWDMARSSELTPSSPSGPSGPSGDALFAGGVRVLREAAVVGDLRVDWPRTASCKAHRRRLKAQYWLLVANADELPPDEGRW